MCFSFWRKNMEEVNHSHYFTRLMYWLPLKASQGRHQKTQGSFRLRLTFKVSWVGAKWQELYTCYWLVTGCELTQERGSPEWGDSLQGGKRGWPANSISSSWPASHSLKGMGQLVANPTFHYNSVGLFLSLKKKKSCNFSSKELSALHTLAHFSHPFADGSLPCSGHFHIMRSDHGKPATVIGNPAIQQGFCYCIIACFLFCHHIQLPLRPNLNVIWGFVSWRMMTSQGSTPF